MRIIGGKMRGMRLAVPKDIRIRPTADRTRESIFNILENGIGIRLSGARVIDLFAGTGALGLEALSRGASFVLFVEEGAEARGLIRDNVEATKQTGTTKLYRRDATRLGAPGILARFDIAFLDPPYGKSLGERALEALHKGGWLRPSATIVLEESADHGFSMPHAFRLIDQRNYGAAAIYFLTYMEE